MIQRNLPPASRDPDETIDIFELVRDVVDDPDVWLERPHEMLGAKSPRELIGTNREQFVRNLLRGLKHGMAP